MKRSTWRRWLWITFGAVALVLAAFVYSASEFIAGACSNDQVEEFPSPDASMKAIVYRRDCGATTDFSRQIVILARDRSLPRSPKPFFASDGDMVVIPRWEDGSHLAVAYAPTNPQYGATAVRKFDSAGAVKITYRELP